MEKPTVDLSNINLFPEPDPLIPPIHPIAPPPLNTEVMGAIDNASMGMNTVEPIQPITSSTEPDLSHINIQDLTKFPDEAKFPDGGIDLSHLTNDNFQDAADFQIEELQKQLQEPQTLGTNLFDTPFDAMGQVTPSTLPPTEVVDETVTPALKQSIAGGGSPANAMRPGPLPRPVTGIPGYGAPGRVPREPKPGSLHSDALDREDAFSEKNNSMQTKVHSAVEKAFQQDLEQGRQRNERIQNQNAQRDFDRSLKCEKPKTLGSKLPKETKPCPRCEESNIDLEWKMCIPCMQEILKQIEARIELNRG
jgi:hypothetical protein